MKYCSECGERAELGSVFCGVCGMKFGTDSGTQPAERSNIAAHESEISQSNNFFSEKGLTAQSTPKLKIVVGLLLGAVLAAAVFGLASLNFYGESDDYLTVFEPEIVVDELASSYDELLDEPFDILDEYANEEVLVSASIEEARRQGGMFIKRADSFYPLISGDIPYHRSGGNIIMLRNTSPTELERAPMFRQGDELVFFSLGNAPDTLAVVRIDASGFTTGLHFNNHTFDGVSTVRVREGGVATWGGSEIEEINGYPAAQFSQYAVIPNAGITLENSDHMLHGSFGEHFVLGLYSGTAWVEQQVFTDYPYFLYRLDYSIYTFQTTTTREGYIVVNIPPEFKEFGSIAIFAQDFSGNLITGRNLNGRSNFILCFE